MIVQPDISKLLCPSVRVDDNLLRYWLAVSIDSMAAIMVMIQVWNEIRVHIPARRGSAAQNGGQRSLR